MISHPTVGAIGRAPLRPGHSKPVVQFLFCLTLVCSIIFPVWRIGPIPVKAGVAAAFFLYLLFRYWGTFRYVCRSQSAILVLTSLFAILGGIVSAANMMSLPDLVSNLIEVHAQTAMNIIMGSMVIKLCGVQAALRAFLISIGITAIVAVLQFTGFNFAWDLRSRLASIQGETFSQFSYFNYGRPMGLSFSPIVLATQLCLALAAYCSVNASSELAVVGRKSRVFVAAFVFIFVCFASGNRSPILGGIILIFIYFAMLNPKYAVPILVLTLVSSPLLSGLLDNLEGSGSRVVNFDDKSALGRIGLYYYGILLFLARPYGYGLGFDPTLYWHDYWSEIAAFPNAAVITGYPLHNYILNMLNFYGVFILFLMPLTLKMLFKQKRVWIYFIPYVIHILFHNAGPFWNDTFVWFAIAIATSTTTEVRPTPEYRDEPSFQRRAQSYGAHALNRQKG